MWGNKLYWGICLFVLGCATARPALPPPTLPSLPQAHEVRAGQCILLSDVPIPPHHALLRQLESLPEEICRELHLPACTHFVQVYLFADRKRYEAYMNYSYPELPYRRAFFIARAGSRFGEELCIFTFWGDHVQEDLRHELTHATLHSVLKNVPMWLDEGLAEYFETPTEARGTNREHITELAKTQELNQPTWPDLAHLEKLVDVQQMNAADYRASWGLVHWLLRASPQGRTLLLHYLQQLRQDAPPPVFGPRLRQAIPHYEDAVRQHLRTLHPVTAQRFSCL